MGVKIPLTGSTNGRPITVDDMSATSIHQSKAGEMDALDLTVLNTTGGAIVVTIAQNGASASVSVAANGSFPLKTAVADGDLLTMQGASAGLRAMGVCERDPRFKS